MGRMGKNLLACSVPLIQHKIKNPLYAHRALTADCMANFNRIAAILVPCLLTDPLLATAAHQLFRERPFVVEHSSVFNEQALSPRAVNTGEHPRQETVFEYQLVSSVAAEILGVSGFVMRVSAADDPSIRQWMKAWDHQLDESRSHWRTISEFRLPYNSKSPHIAYDPYLIPVRRIGPYLRFTLQELPESDALAVTREEAAFGADHSNLDRERTSNLLVVDPDDNRMLVINNRWPKMPYDSLLIPDVRQPQRLTREVIRAEIRWAYRGLASEFHRAKQFVDDLHIHLYPQTFLPVNIAATTFEAVDSAKNVEVGTFNYFVPHLALASTDPVALEKAVLELSEYLEYRGAWFNQHMLAIPGTPQLLAYFVLWNEKAKGFGFNTSGFLKIGDESILDETVLAKLMDSWANSSLLQDVQEVFWHQWRNELATTVVKKNLPEEAA